MSFSGMVFGISLADYIVSAKSRGVTGVDVAVYEVKEEQENNRFGIFFEEMNGKRSWFQDRLSIDHLLFFDYHTAFSESYRAAVYLGNNGILATVNGQPVDDRLVRAKN